LHPARCARARDGHFVARPERDWFPIPASSTRHRSALRQRQQPLDRSSRLARAPRACVQNGSRPGPCAAHGGKVGPSPVRPETALLIPKTSGKQPGGSVSGHRHADAIVEFEREESRHARTPRWKFFGKFSGRSTSRRSDFGFRGHDRAPALADCGRRRGPNVCKYNRNTSTPNRKNPQRPPSTVTGRVESRAP
jgi:hypothetical protein